MSRSEVAQIDLLGKPISQFSFMSTNQILSISSRDIFNAVRTRFECVDDEREGNKMPVVWLLLCSLKAI